MRSTALLWAVSTSVALVGAAGCDRAPAPAAPVDAAAEPDAGVASPQAPSTEEEPLDLATVMERTHYAFRPDGESFVTDDAALVVRATDGVLVSSSPSLADLEVETVALRRGSSEVALARPRTAPTPIGGLTIDRGAVVESIRQAGDGLHQEWSFAAAPAGSGDLVVQVAIRGLEFAIETEQGLHFLDAEGRGWRYGHGTWIDAAGRESEVRARALGPNRVELLVSAGTLADTRWPALLDPIISPENGVDAATRGPAAGRQSAPVIAAGPTVSVVAWYDERAGSGGAIYGARLDRAPMVLDPVGIAMVPSGADTGIAPGLAAGTGGYLLAWASAGTVRGQLLAADAQPMGASFVISATSTGAGAPVVVWDGARYVVAWTDRRAGNDDVYAARVTAAGAVVDAGGIAVCREPTNQSAVHAARIGTRVLFVWTELRHGTADVYGARFDGAAGTVLDPDGFAIDVAVGDQRDAAVGCSAMSCMVIWSEASRLYKVMVAPDATIVPGTRGVGSVPFGGGSVDTKPAVAFGTDRYHVSYHRLSSGLPYIFMSDFDAGGSGSCCGSTISSTSDGTITYGPPAIVYDGTQFIHVWADDRNARGTPDVFGSRESFGSGFIVSTSLVNQSVPAVAWNGMDWLVAWTDQRGTTGSDVYAVRVAPTGVPREAMGIPIVTANGNQTSPAVASDGASWLVVWSDARTTSGEIYGTRVTAAGMNTIADGFRIATGTQTLRIPAVAWGGTQYLVVWNRRSGTADDIYGARVGPLGTLIDTTAQRICGATGAQDLPAVASNGTDFLVAWTDLRVGEDVYGAVVRRDGIVSPADGRALASASGAQRAPAIAFHGGDYTVAFLHVPTGSVAVQMQRVDIFGLPSGSPLEIAVSSSQEAPDISVYGPDAVVAWTRYSTDTGGDVYAARVQTTGTLDPGGVVVSAAASREYRVQVSGDGAGHALVVYEAFVADPAVSSYRVRTRVIDFTMGGASPIGAACTSGWACASGFCVDGFCCDSACGLGATTARCSSCARAGGATADGRCTAFAAGTVCRASTGPCDPAEACGGTAAPCAADGRHPAGTPCGAPPPGPCAEMNVCNGTSAACIMGGLMPAGTSCRPVAGECDVAEACTGTSAVCPVDTMRARGFVCRPTTEGCDVPETCDGTTPACPADVIASTARICRSAAGGCDLEERCDGITTRCPMDIRRRAGAVCRAVAGDCDVEEVCTGRETSCPRDVFAPAGGECRASAGACDVAEVCSGTDGDCPGDALVPSGFVCRDAAGVCDVAEACDGASGACPADHFVRDGAPCSDARVCNGLEVCATGMCTAGAPLECASGEVCEDAVNGCLPEEAGCGCTVPGARARSARQVGAILLALVALVARVALRRRRRWR